MFKVTDVVQLKDGERVQAVVRQHGIVLLPRLVLAGLLIALPFFFLFSLSHAGTGGVLVFALCVALGLVIALRSFLMWDSDVLLVTSERLVDVDQRGLWARIVAETPLSQVHEVVWLRKGLLPALCRTGTLRIRSGASSDIVCSGVPRPERVSRLIEDLCDRKGGRAQHSKVHDYAAVAEWIGQVDRASLERARKTIAERLSELENV